MARRGPRRGVAQRGRESGYDITSGLPYRTSVQLEAEAAAKMVRAHRNSNLSLSGLINELIERMPVDEQGRPVWLGEVEQKRQADQNQGRLPLNGLTSKSKAA